MNKHTKETQIMLFIIFASQGLRSALLIFTLGIVSRIFVIPAHCHLLDFDSYAPCNYVIFSQSTRLLYSLALIIFVVSEKKAFEHFPIGSNVNLCPAVVATLDIRLA